MEKVKKVKACTTQNVAVHLRKIPKDNNRHSSNNAPYGLVFVVLGQVLVSVLDLSAKLEDLAS